MVRRVETVEGLTPEQFRHRPAFGDLVSIDPNAWLKRRVSPEEITTPSPDNRIVGYPYTKLEVAIMDVDEAGIVAVPALGQQRPERFGDPQSAQIFFVVDRAADQF